MMMETRRDSGVHVEPRWFRLKHGYWMFKERKLLYFLLILLSLLLCDAGSGFTFTSSISINYKRGTECWQAGIYTKCFPLFQTSETKADVYFSFTAFLKE